MEVFVRLSLALMLSLSLAVLLAWGWYSSDLVPASPESAYSTAGASNNGAPPAIPAN